MVWHNANWLIAAGFGTEGSASAGQMAQQAASRGPAGLRRQCCQGHKQAAAGAASGAVLEQQSSGRGLCPVAGLCVGTLALLLAVCVGSLALRLAVPCPEWICYLIVV